MKNGGMKGNLRIPRVPLEWYGSGSLYGRGGNVWRLPSGKALAEFALQSGFVAPLLFKADIAAPKKATPIPATKAAHR